MTINLDTLRKTAEAEETQKWGGWAFEEDDFDGFCIYINDGDNFGRSYVAKDLTQGESEGESTAKFIAAFDPPTVLALLSRLEQAEQQRDSSREACKTLAEVLSNHSEWIVEATDSQDLIGEDGDGDWDVVWDRVMELGEAKRKAEQAVARVREFSDQMLKPHGQNVVVAARVRERLAEILDGDGRG